MQVDSKIAATLVAVLIIAGSIARAATAPSEIARQYPAIERMIEQHAASVTMSATQTNEITGPGFGGELTVREAYSASGGGPGVPCGACVDPCRSFSLAITIVGGNGRFVGDACLSSSGWRVRNISQRSWLNQPAPPVMLPPAQPETQTVVYRDTTLDLATVTAIRANLVRLNYLRAASPGGDELQQRLDEFVQDHNVAFSGNESERAQQIVALVGHTSEAVAHSTAPTEECVPPGGASSARAYTMCGHIGRRS